ncbi:MAG TPA: hypothetical protein VKU39_10100 [Streptosporangiaceae bacterium]|nr:hypothetical protein [Streptosporangiaceae bacterium]
MKLLGLEASQNSYYYQPRYRRVVDLGADLFILAGLSTTPCGSRPTSRARSRSGC